MTEPLLTSEPVVTAVGRGFTVKQGGYPHWVFASCGREDVGYWCNTHQHYFETRAELRRHTKESGDHEIARCCPKHGFESPEKPTP